MLSLTRCRKVLALFAAFVAFQVAPVVAQTAPEAPLPSTAPATPSPPTVELTAQAPLTLSQLLELGRSRNPEWAAALAGPRAAEGDLLQAGMIPNPVVSVSADYELPFQMERFHMENAGLAVSQELELGGKRRARIAFATARLEAARSLDLPPPPRRRGVELSKKVCLIVARLPGDNLTDRRDTAIRCREICH